MSENKRERKGGLNKGVVWFFVFAIACVAAFLIVGLVRTCNADHEEKELEEQIIQQQELGMASESNFQLIA